MHFSQTRKKRYRGSLHHIQFKLNLNFNMFLSIFLENHKISSYNTEKMSKSQQTIRMLEKMD